MPVRPPIPFINEPQSECTARRHDRFGGRWESGRRRELQPEAERGHEQTIARLMKEGRTPMFEQYAVTAAEAAR
jgi:hypothetical protein